MTMFAVSRFRPRIIVPESGRTCSVTTPSQKTSSTRRGGAAASSSSRPRCAVFVEKESAHCSLFVIRYSLFARDHFMRDNDVIDEKMDRRIRRRVDKGKAQATTIPMTLRQPPEGEACLRRSRITESLSTKTVMWPAFSLTSMSSRTHCHLPTVNPLPIPKSCRISASSVTL